MSTEVSLAAANFTPAAFALLIASAAVAVLFAVIFAVRFAASFPDLPAPGPETSELGTEPPAIANLLVHRCEVTSAAAAATLIDLAARRHVELFEAGPDRFVVRLREERTEPVTDYERQVLTLVRQKAVGGSAPLEAIELDANESEGWRKRFATSVVADAKARGLLRGRWSRADWVVFGSLAAIALLLLACALYVTRVQETGQTDSRSFDREDWFFVVIVAWFVIMALLRSLRSIRFSTAGDAVAARWLGVKRFLQHDSSFGDSSPAGVAIWDRLLAYGAALGVARGAVAAIPLEEEDPGIAWSRVGGDWHQVHVEYPTRFGYGERPSSVLLNGALRTVVFGTVAFVVLPTVVRVAWDAGGDALDNLGNGATLAIVALFAALFGGIAALIVVRLADGVIRLYRGATDLRQTITVTGSVVKHHRGEEASWFAVDPGDVDEVQAVHPGDDGITPPRGASVRMVITPRLRHVVKVEVVSR